MVYSGEGKVEGRDTYLLLEAGLAPVLDQVFQKLKFRTTATPAYRCILTISVFPTIVNNARTPVAHIIGLELLGSCDLLQVARHHYEKAFGVIQITPRGALVTYGDGATWVGRLGGEEGFVLPLRRKLRDLQRRLVAEHDQAIVDQTLRVGLAGAVNMAAAADQRYHRTLAALMGMRIGP